MIISKQNVYGMPNGVEKKMLNLTLEVKLQRGVDLFQFESK